MSVLTRRLTLLDERLWHRLRSLQHFAAANRRLFVYLVVAAGAAFGYDLVSFSLKTDAELHAFSAGAKVEWIQQGRWAMYLLNAGLMPDPVMPLVPVVIGVLGLACGVFFFMLSLSGQRTLSHYLAAPLAVACPLLAFGFYFTTLNYGLGVALGAVGAGHYSLTRWRRSFATVAIVCFAFAIGIYQATLLVIPVLFGFYLVARIIAIPHVDARLLLRYIGVFVVVTLAACGLYELMKLATVRAYGVTYADEYLQGYLKWRTDASYWEATIRNTIFTGRAYYTGNADYYVYKLGVLGALFWIALSLTVVRLVAAPQSAFVKTLGLLALVVALSAPLLLHLLNGGHMPPRTAVGVPFVLAGMVFCATFQGNRNVSVALAVLVAVCFFKFAVVNSRYALANELAWKADQDLSLLILQRIHSVWHKLPERSAPYPVVLVGMLEARQSPLYVSRDLIGASFYQTNGGSVGRVVALWRSMRQFDFRHASDQEAIAVAGRAAVMPSWPADGSVDVIDGVIVVKIGEFTATQIITLCTYDPSNTFCEHDAHKLLTFPGTAPAGTTGFYQGLWSSSPAGLEAAWGLELAHQGDTVFASWFTYDSAGRSWWLVMPAQRQKTNLYVGTLIAMRGPSFAATEFDSAAVVSTPVGSGTLAFIDTNNAVFDYTVDGIRHSKSITRAALGSATVCRPGEAVQALLKTSYQGLWGAAPVGSEPGWGLSLNHQGDTIAGTWFTYDLDGAPLWLSVTARQRGAATYVGDLFRKSGTRFDAFAATAVRSTKVGTASIAFADADHATFTFTIDGIGAAQVTRTKAIARAVAGSPTFRCRWPSANASRSGKSEETASILSGR